MKKLTYLVALTLLFFTGYCDPAVEDFGHTAAALAATTDANKIQETERQETQRNAEDRLNQLSNRIKDLKAQASKASKQGS